MFGLASLPHEFSRLARVGLQWADIDCSMAAVQVLLLQMRGGVSAGCLGQAEGQEGLKGGCLHSTE